MEDSAGCPSESGVGLFTHRVSVATLRSARTGRLRRRSVPFPCRGTAPGVGEMTHGSCVPPSGWR